MGGSKLCRTVGRVGVGVGVPGSLLLCVIAIRSVNEIIAAKNQFGVNYKSLTAK